MTAEVLATLPCSDSDCRSSASSSRLDRWHLGQIAMSNNEMRSQMISDRDEETKVVSSVTSDSRFVSSISVSRWCMLLWSAMTRWWRRLWKLHEWSSSSATRLPRARSWTPKHARFLDFWQYRDGGGSPKLCDSFSGDMAMVATTAIIGDWGLEFNWIGA